MKQSCKQIFKICNKKWYVIDKERKDDNSDENPIKFLTSSIESSLYDYFDAYILVTGNTTVARTIAAVNASKSNSLLQLHKLHLKIVSHLKNVGQKSIKILLKKQVLLILQCLFTI